MQKIYLKKVMCKMNWQCLKVFVEKYKIKKSRKNYFFQIQKIMNKKLKVFKFLVKFFKSNKFQMRKIHYL